MPVDSGNPSQQHSRPDASAATGDSTSHSLLARLRNEEDHAWNELVVLYGPLVHCWCRNSPISEQEISDIVQEVFRAVWTNIDRFRTDRAGDTFRGWLRTITRNKIADFYRREGQSPAAFGGTDAQLRFMAVPDAAFGNNDDDLQVLHVLHALL